MRKVYFLFGTTNSGKSYYIKNTLISEFSGQSIIIIDTMNEYKIPRFIITEDIIDLITLFQAFRHNPHIIFRIKEARSNDFLDICEIASKLENICLLIDEIAYYPDAENPHLENIIRQGRHYNQSLIIATQCPVDLPPVYRNNVTGIYFFQLLEKRYIDYCRAIIGDRANRLMMMPQGEFIKFPDCLTNENDKP